MPHTPHIAQKRLSFPGDGAELHGELFTPESALPLPGVVLLHDRHGLTGHVRDTARRLAAQGYAVLAFDLFSRGDGDQQDPPSREQSRKLSFFPDERAVRDVQAALSRLRSEPGVDPKRIALGGFSFGARYSLLTAGAGEDVAALFVFYPVIIYPELHASRPRQPLSLVPAIKCPVMTVFGEKDWMVPLQHQTFMEELLKGHGLPRECIRYPSVGHGFFNEEIKQYDKAVAEDAFARLVAFLERHVNRAG